MELLRNIQHSEALEPYKRSFLTRFGRLKREWRAGNIYITNFFCSPVYPENMHKDLGRDEWKRIGYRLEQMDISMQQ
jgi:hypothetical protein